MTPIFKLNSIKGFIPFIAISNLVISCPIFAEESNQNNLLNSKQKVSQDINQSKINNLGIGNLNKEEAKLIVNC